MKIKVWDLATRLFHWGLVIAFGFVVYSAFQDKIVGGFDVMHRRAGIMILILVVFRLFWGVVGSDTARFTRFVKSPKSILQYLKGESNDSALESVGHSPLGALSVVAMLVLLLVQATMGLFSTDGILFDGPLASLVENSERITLIHRWTGYTLMGLVGLHITAIAFYKLVKKKALLLAMITGRTESNVQQPHLQKQWLAGLLFFVAGAIVCGTVFILLA